MRKIHVTQDDFGFWFISLEEPDGTMKLVAHHYVAAAPAIEDARELIDEETRLADTSLHAAAAEGALAEIVMLVDAPRRTTAAAAAAKPAAYKTPKPRKVRT